VSGLAAAARVFALVDPAVGFRQLVRDGERVAAGAELARVSGSAASLLAAERTALNLLQRLAGIATATRRLVDAVAGLPCLVLDTRKTTPGWRLLEKAAVRDGGGVNHRFSLSDGVLIRTTTGLPGGVAVAVPRCARERSRARDRGRGGNAAGPRGPRCGANVVPRQR
jgi:nicotinate-nucleotide pyrophosphorylase (carboxylating)